MIIIQLGALETAAAQCGDDRTAATLRAATELLFADKSALDELEVFRRDADERKRRDRERHPRKPPRISRNSTEFHGTVGIPDRSPGFSPTPPFPAPSVDTTHHTAGAREANAASRTDTLYAESVENLTGLLSTRMGEHWPDVDGFLKRRLYETWKAWMKEMLTLLTSSGAGPADVAQVCRDDAALARPIGSPKGFRIFVASAVEERVHPKPSKASNPSHPAKQNGRGGARHDAMLDRWAQQAESNGTPGDTVDAEVIHGE